MPTAQKTAFVKQGTSLRDLLAERAYEEAARRSWVEVHRDGRRAGGVIGAAAYLWLDDLHNADAMLSAAGAGDGGDAQRLVGELIALRQGAGLSPAFPSLLEKVFVADPAIAAFAITYLERQTAFHHWQFAAAVDWRLSPLVDRDFDRLLTSVFDVSFELAALVLSQHLSSARASAKSFLPPANFVTTSNLSEWRRALHQYGAPHDALFSALLEYGHQATELVNAPRNLTPEEVLRARVLAKLHGDVFPALTVPLLAGLAKKSENVLPTAAALDVYRDAFERLTLEDGAYRWLRRETIARARERANQPALSHHELDAYSPAEIRLLILACAAVGEELCGVVLAEVLRRENPDRATSVLAGWLSLYFNAPSWSGEGFKQLGWVAPQDAGAFPFMHHWPYTPMPKAVVDEYRQARETWPRISVVVPSYQQGQFLQQTLLSLLNQDYPDLEIIVEDGGSTDETGEVLERYRSRLAHVRSGPDGGQSDALAQGFKLATGEILCWLNSDDMFAPLALFHVAEAYLKGAELIVGSCFEFKDQRFVQINLPSLAEGPLDPKGMADLKGKWFMGHYFYQPEVFFSADVYRRAGGYVDASLHYTMDYDLWMRLAEAGAQVGKVRWPVALFRRHSEQKTYNLDRTVIEQGEVRKKHVPQITDPRKIRSLRRRLAAVWAKPDPRILVATGKYGRFFPVGFEEEVREAFEDFGCVVDFVAAKRNLSVADYDIVVSVVTLTPDELAFLEAARAQESGPVLVGWFWDNHHMFRENLEFASLFDIGFAAHDFAKAYLETSTMWLRESHLIPYTQWSRQTFDKLGGFQKSTDRSDELQGGFVAYPDAPERIRRVEALKQSGHFPNLRLIDPVALGGYYNLTQADRFLEWCGAKVSLCANVERDVPIRFFDALVTGQVPILPANALDAGLLRERYPEESFVVVESLGVEDVRAGLAEALAIFDRAGAAGLEARVERAMRAHSFQARLRDLLNSLKQAAHD